MSDEGANSFNTHNERSGLRSGGKRAGQKPRSSLKMFMRNSNFSNPRTNTMRYTKLALNEKNFRNN